VNHNVNAFGVRGNRSCSTTPFTHSGEIKLRSFVTSLTETSHITTPSVNRCSNNLVQTPGGRRTVEKHQSKDHAFLKTLINMKFEFK
jgi:hypothetical protein